MARTAQEVLEFDKLRELLRLIVALLEMPSNGEGVPLLGQSPPSRIRWDCLRMIE